MTRNANYETYAPGALECVRDGEAINWKLSSKAADATHGFILDDDFSSAFSATYTVAAPDGEQIDIHEITINGLHLGYASTQTLDPGVVYVESDADTAADDDVPAGLSYATGTMILTANGEKPIEEIREGDLVITREFGPQRVLWSGASTLPARRLAAKPTLQPVRIRKGALGDGLPQRDLIVSGQHRVLVDTLEVAFYYGVDSAFATAKGLVNGDSVLEEPGGAGIKYHQLLLEDHCTIQANGCWSETLFAGEVQSQGTEADAKAYVDALIGPRAETMETAYMCLLPWESRLLSFDQHAEAEVACAA